MKTFAIFGDPVAHSVSPILHNLAIKGLGINASYSRIAIPEGNELKNIFNRYNLDGVNVTVPHKETAYKLCDEIKGIAKDIQAVNTIVKLKNKLVGFNTDAAGFYQSVEQFKTDKVLILGAGGTARAIAYILRLKNKDVTILNRSETKLNSFEQNGFKTFSWKNFKMQKYDTVINTTSAGMKDNSYPLDYKILEELLSNAKYAVDVIYNIETPFLKLAKKYVEIKNGKDMLLYQAVLAFNLFFNNRYDNEKIKEYMEQGFNL
ncbi:MAG: Shikimate 5-dehydrogenase I alpha (EC [uncultured Campylobacterales bacterium]|uniref:Shikimate dehydrogenase (NADP(+)) n=1 Tax=uncultured Campylobacterales bacterium TaxID=352960 RepID=A0A6S6T0D5_9BACT|nr:MAG: Shikimate 5-dehydrogenase I alpha (EC [uncultured Campylobacterales bacterium]